LSSLKTTKKKEDTEESKPLKKVVQEAVYTTASGAASGAAVTLGTQAGVHVIGFGAAGIAKGSAAAYWMSMYGGTVCSGSSVAILQSIGAAGLGSATLPLLAVGAAAGAGAYVGYRCYTVGPAPAPAPEQSQGSTQE